MTASLQSAGLAMRYFHRDDVWLGEHLDHVWSRYFRDVPRVNHVDIAFAKRWKARLGLITLCEESSITSIRLNSLLSHPVVPECVTTITVAHEMVHYAHGFGSPLPRRCGHPHKGGIVEKELFARGLEAKYCEYQDWIDQNWECFYHTEKTARRHYWLPLRGGETVRLGGNGNYYREAAAAIGHSRTSAEAVPERDPEGRSGTSRPSR